MDTIIRLHLAAVLLALPLTGCDNTPPETTETVGGDALHAMTTAAPGDDSARADAESPQSLADIGPTSGIETAHPPEQSKKNASESVGAGNTIASNAAPIARFDADKLAVSCNDAPLADVLNAIQEVSGIVITSDDDVATQRITAAIEPTTIDDALRRLLRHYDVFFLYGTHAEDATRLTSLWVYDKGRAANVHPQSATAWADAASMERALTSDDPLQRVRAYDAAIEQKGPNAADIVGKGLADPDEFVRTEVLSKAISVGARIDVGLLQSMLQSDRSARVRALALDAAAMLLINDAPTLRTLADIAARDESDAVREPAKEILARGSNNAALADDIASTDTATAAGAGQVVGQ